MVPLGATTLIDGAERRKRGGRSMRRPGGWWRRKSTPAKVETYTRWSYHFFGLIEIATVVLATVGTAGPAASAVFLPAACAHAALSMLTASRALDWLRGRRGRP
ncbi:sensor histidine kinase, partial [Streptomyces sp. SID7958]|nr:sensor histidine kinase [Streptomyces sp. SID7958]